MTERYCEPQNNWIAAKIVEWAGKNNVDVEVSWLTWAEITPKLATAMEAGTLPDVFYGGVSPVLMDPTNIYTLPVDDILNELGWDNIFERHTLQVKIKGKYYAVPFGNMINVTHLIKSLFEKGKKAANITDFPDSGGPLPETWDDYVLLAEAMKKWDPNHHAFGLTLGEGATDGSETWCMTWFPYGGEFMTEPSVSGIKFRSKESVENMYRIKEWYDKGYISPDAITESGYWNNEQYLTRASVVIVEGPTPFYKATTTDPSLVADTMLLPPPSGPKGLIGLGGTYSWHIIKTTEHQDLCKDLILYFYKDKKAYTSYVVDGACCHIPLLKDVAEEAAKQFMPEIIGPYMEALEKCTVATQTWPYNLPSRVQGEIYSDFTYAHMMMHVLVDGWEPEKAVDWAADHIEEIAKRVYGS